ncbi:undecaprenyl-diphosphatase UppP [Candidatus Omnitrophota bacterium]
MTILHAIVFGIVEGFTEFLPISSTGHLILTADLLGIVQGSFVKSFAIAIQLGAILAVLCLYGKSLVTDVRIVKRILVAFIPTAVIGALSYAFIKRFLLGNVQVVLWALLAGGVAIILFELLHGEKKDAVDSIPSMTYVQSLLIGAFQSFAMIPGVSRAAATIVGGLLVGLKRKTIVEFSFLLAVPTMLAATAFDLFKSANGFGANHLVVLSVGFLTSFIVALFAITFFLKFVKNHTFLVFGFYRIAIVVVYVLFFLK